MSKTDVDPDQIVSDAEQEAAEAEKLVETLEEAVKSGDDSVTFEQVEKARGLLSFVRLRHEGATRKAAKAAHERDTAAAKAAVANAVKLVRDLPGNAPELSTLEDAAVAAVRAYFDAATSMHDEIRAAVSAINDATDRAAELGLATPAEHGIAIEPHQIWVSGEGGKRVSIVLGDYTSRTAVRGLLERTGVAEFTIGGDARLTPEMREISLPNNAERF